MIFIFITCLYVLSLKRGLPVQFAATVARKSKTSYRNFSAAAKQKQKHLNERSAANPFRQE
jgi:hypothetical protein